MSDATRYIISDRDVLSAINYAISWNDGDEDTVNLLIHVGADIFGIGEYEFKEILSKYQDY